jgi:lysozyme
MSLIEDIKIEEGFRGDPYKDHLGYLTIGYGTKLPLTKEEAELLLKHRLEKMQKELNRRIEEVYGKVSMPAKAWELLYHMAYQMGVSGVMNFKKMLGALVNRNYKLASQEALDSRWAMQTPERAMRIANEMAKIKDE